MFCLVYLLESMRSCHTLQIFINDFKIKANYYFL